MPSGLGLPEIVVISFVFFLLAAIGGARSALRLHVGTTLVLRRFAVTDVPPAPPQIEIVGRASGLVGYLLTVLGLEAETTFTMQYDEIRFRSASLSGQLHHMVPLTSVASAHCGYSKPVGLLFLGAILALFGVVVLIEGGRDGGSGLLLVLIAGGLFIAYALKKKLTLAFETAGGLVLGLAFKRSVMENVSVDMDEALKVVELVSRRIMVAQGRAPARPS